MLAIDGGESDFALVMPRRHGGVVGMVLALEDGGLGVSRIEPRVGEAGIPPDRQRQPRNRCENP
jgi:hypothetical protein